MANSRDCFLDKPARTVWADAVAKQRRFAMDMRIVAQITRNGRVYLLGTRPYLTADGWLFACFARPEHRSAWKITELRDYVLEKDLLEDIDITFGDYDLKWLCETETESSNAQAK